MNRRNWTALAAVALTAAIVTVPSALAAYTTAKLEVRQAGNATIFKLTQSSSDDATALARIIVPAGTTLTTSQPPGTVLGDASALLKLHGLAGAELPVDGNVVVAAPGQVSATSQQACLQGATPLATWVLVVSIAGNTVPVPLYLVATSGPLVALGPAYVTACFTSPYLSVAQGGLAGGPQLVNAEFGIQGVFSRVATGAFVGILVPWTPGTGTPNQAGTIATAAAVAPGGLTVTAKRSGKATIVSGRVTQGGQGRAGATVAIRGGAKASSLKQLGTVKTGGSGNFRFRAKTGTFFRASVVATVAAAPQVCATLAPALAPVPCVNPTTNGFIAQSKTVRKK